MATEERQPGRFSSSRFTAKK